VVQEKDGDRGINIRGMGSEMGLLEPELEGGTRT